MADERSDIDENRVHVALAVTNDANLETRQVRMNDTTKGVVVDVAAIVPGTSATSLGKAEDSAHASGDTGVMFLAVRKDTPTALAGADGDYAPLEVDASGNTHVNLGTKIAGEDQANDVIKSENQMSFLNITTATTTTVKSGAGFFHCVVINTTAAGTITIYDNTAASGTKIGTIVASAGVATYLYDVKFNNGLTLVTAAASDLTVSYR